MTLAQGSGSIVNVVSIEGMEGFGTQMVYDTSKAGVIQMTPNMALDFGAAGVRVNCVCPGVIETPMTAILEHEEARELRDQMVSVVSPAKSFRASARSCRCNQIPSVRRRFIYYRTSAGCGWGLCSGQALCILNQ